MKGLAIKTSLVTALCLSACSTTQGTRYDGTTDPRPGLSSGDLQEGECGLFVWRKDEAKTFIMLSTARKARIYVDEEFTFTPNTDPLAPEQTFTADEREWTLRLSNPKTISQGTRYDAGTLKTVTDGGWELIVSVIGLTLCNTPDALS